MAAGDGFRFHDIMAVNTHGYHLWWLNFHQTTWISDPSDPDWPRNRHFCREEQLLIVGIRCAIIYRYLWNHPIIAYSLLLYIYIHIISYMFILIIELYVCVYLIIYTYIYMSPLIYNLVIPLLTPKLAPWTQVPELEDDDAKMVPGSNCWNLRLSSATEVVPLGTAVIIYIFF